LDLPENKGFHKENREGLLMWSVPYYVKNENRLIFFVESSEFNKNEGDDTLFALLFCISSLIIYNIMGEIDEKKLNVMPYIGNLNNLVKDFKKINHSKLVWVFRDVNEKTLKQTLEGGFSQVQMLESKMIEIVKKKNELKRLMQITNEIFPDKYCYFLSKAPETAKSPLKIEFLKSIEPLKNQIEGDLCQKFLYETVLNSRMMLTFINSALETIREKNQIDLTYW